MATTTKKAASKPAAKKTTAAKPAAKKATTTKPVAKKAAARPITKATITLRTSLKGSLGRLCVSKGSPVFA